jgi:hypothetical protein
VAPELPYEDAMNMPSPRPLDLGAPRRRLKTSPAVALWRPQIVLATSITAPPARRAVSLAEPAARPAALGPQLDSARSLLASLEGAGEALGTAAADAHRRAELATSTRDRVSATIAAYRAEAALDDALSGAWRRMSTLMEERGLR